MPLIPRPEVHDASGQYQWEDYSSATHLRAAHTACLVLTDLLKLQLTERMMTDRPMLHVLLTYVAVVIHCHSTNIHLYFVTHVGPRLEVLFLSGHGVVQL